MLGILCILLPIMLLLLNILSKLPLSTMVIVLSMSLSMVLPLLLLFMMHLLLFLVRMKFCIDTHYTNLIKGRVQKEKK